MKHIRLPLTEADIAALQAGDEVLLSGPLYTARDAAHQRLCRCLQEGKPLPVELAGETIYYVGPSPAKPGEVIGSAGPTTSYRMDPYTPPLLALGLKGMIGKGRRSVEVVQAIREHGAGGLHHHRRRCGAAGGGRQEKNTRVLRGSGTGGDLPAGGGEFLRYRRHRQPGEYHHSLEAARRGGFFMPCGGTWHGSCYYNLTENRSIPDKTGRETLCVFRK